MNYHGPPGCENVPAAGGRREKLGGGELQSSLDSLSTHAVTLCAGPVLPVLNAEVLLKGRGGGVSRQLGPVSHSCCFVGIILFLDADSVPPSDGARVKLSTQGTSREGGREGTDPAVYEWFPQPLLLLLLLQWKGLTKPAVSWNCNEVLEAGHFVFLRQDLM